MSNSSLVRSRSGSALATLSGVAARTPDGSTLFENLTLAFGRERTGVVGFNGAGKTTLLRLVAGFSAPVEGRVTRPGRIGWLDQHFETPPDQSVAELLGIADALSVLRRVEAGRGDADDLAAADWSLEGRVRDALSGVGLRGIELWRPAASLSGGEKTRLQLARLALNAPDLLILDEPTNHLDAEGRAAIAHWLDGWPGGAIVASHDRSLLRGMDRIVEISDLGVAVYGGNYDLYAQCKAAERARAVRHFEVANRALADVRRDAQRAVEKKARRDKAGRAFAERRSEPKILLGAMAERAELSGGRERRLAERRLLEASISQAEARERVERSRQLEIPMASCGLTSSGLVVVLDEVSVMVGTHSIVGPLSLRIAGPERVAVTGPNGAGKSTLLGVMEGRVEATCGQVDQRVRAVMLDQQASVLRGEETLLESYRRLNPEASPNQAQAALARFLFRNASAHRQVGSLSGGERLRAALACVMGTRPPQLLLLDEPTNHLDLESIEAVETALRAYDGALVVVSHDEDFLSAVGVERRLELRPGGSG